MTATERLRAMLDERGVEWWEPVQMEGSEFTRWHDANGVQWTASEVHGGNKLRIGANCITPEQAIAATLGSEAENADLRRERDFYFAQATENGERAGEAVDGLNAENAKLRELVFDMWNEMHADTGRAQRRMALADRMIELGVEV